MIKTIRGIQIILIFSIPGLMTAQIPSGYYDAANGLDGESLRSALQGIIDGHNSQSYDNIWTHFQSTDRKSDGKVWDMYTDKPSGTPTHIFSFGTGKCGEYSAEGDCFNREHSFPQSWFGSGSPMKSDLFHVYPTDGYVNGKRGNFPYGEVGSASWTGTNGSKVGSSNTAGYNGTVFEPIDEYKGDFARTYFYMVTRYKSNASGWSSDMLSSGNLSSWAITLLLKWANEDPISQKELDRNNAVHDIQGNRNPFIDNSLYKDYIWNGKPAGISESKSNIALNIHGNQIDVRNNTGKNSTLIIYSVIGSTIKSVEINSNSQQVYIGELIKGIYVAKLGTLHSKFIVQ